MVCLLEMASRYRQLLISDFIELMNFQSDLISILPPLSVAYSFQLKFIGRQ